MLIPKKKQRKSDAIIIAKIVLDKKSNVRNANASQER